MARTLFACMLLIGAFGAAVPAGARPYADVLLFNGKIVTVDKAETIAEAIAISGERILAVGKSGDLSSLAGPDTRRIDLDGRTVVPGLIDNHIHAIRDGLKYDQMVDWDDKASLAEALDALRARAQTVLPGGWIIVAGAWDRNQFPERRLPTPAELEAVSADRPVYVQHQFDTVVMNRTALRRLDVTPARLAAEPRLRSLTVELGADGEPTGVVRGRGLGNPLITLLEPALEKDFERQVKSTASFFGKLNSLGLTGIIDHGDLARDEYRPLFNLWQRGGLNLRIRYNLFAIPPSKGEEGERELGYIRDMTQFLPPRGGDEMLRFLGFGEKLVTGLVDGYMNADPPLALASDGRERGYAFARWAAANGYTLSVHASHGTTVEAILDVFERVNREHPIAPLRWRIEHGEDVSASSLRRMKALGVFYAVQDRLYYGGDDYIRLRGRAVAAASPPLRTALDMGIVVTGGTDGSVIAPSSPFTSLAWMISGRTSSGAPTRSADQLMQRMEALRAYTANGAWASFEEKERGSLEPGKLADLVVLTADYLTVPEAEIAGIRAEKTMVGGRFVYERR